MFHAQATSAVIPGRVASRALCHEDQSLSERYLRALYVLCLFPSWQPLFRSLLRSHNSSLEDNVASRAFRRGDRSLKDTTGLSVVCLFPSWQPLFRVSNGLVFYPLTVPFYSSFCSTRSPFFSTAPSAPPAHRSFLQLLLLHPLTVLFYSSCSTRSPFFSTAPAPPSHRSFLQLLLHPLTVLFYNSFCSTRSPFPSTAPAPPSHRSFLQLVLSG